MFKRYYELFNTYVLRTPFYTLNGLNDYSKILKSEEFKEAIFLSSSNFYNLIKSDYSDPEIKKTALKYVKRSITNPTPFGLFSSFSIGNFTDSNPNFKFQSFKRQTFVNSRLVVEISNSILENEILSKKLKFYLNSSIYITNNKIKYYKSSGGKEKDFQLQSFNYHEVFEKLKKKSKKSLVKQDIFKIIKEAHQNYKEEEIKNFIKLLIDEKILLNELDPNLGPVDNFERILKYLNSNFPEEDYTKKLLLISDKIKKLDNNINNNHFNYEDIINDIVSLKLNKSDEYFNVYLESNFTTNELPKTYKNDIYKGLEVLSKLYKPQKNNYLQKFIKEFEIKYGENKIKLTEVFDDETGLDLNSKEFMDRSYINDFINENSFNKKVTIKDSKFDRLIENKFLLYTINNKEIILSKEDLSAFSSNYNFTNTFSAITEIYEIDNKPFYYFSYVGGSSASNFINRFSKSNLKVERLIKDIFKVETILDKNTYEVDLIHNDVSINVLSSNVKRDNQIVLNGPSFSNDYTNLYLDDLYVKIKDQKVIIQTKTDNYSVSPIISHADNFEDCNYSLYKFLVELQYQSSIKSCSFEWSNHFRCHTYLPRLTYSNIILNKARWRAIHEEVFNINSEKSESTKLNLWLNKRNIPRFIQLDEDNLVVDFENEQDSKTFLKILNKNKEIFFTEFLGHKSLVKKNNNRLVNEFIFILKKKIDDK